jgi:hypothetical protein
MNKRAQAWLISALVYAAFVIWYTDFGGPLSDAEVDAFVSTLEARDTDPALVASLERFFRNDTGRQFLMVNAIDMNDNPPDVEGAAPGENADQLMDRYLEHMFPELLKRASHPVIVGEAVHTALDTLGIEGAEQWTDAAMFRYRSRRSFMEIIVNPEFSGKHDFKHAALDKTLAYPIETSLYLGDLRLLLGLFLLAVTALLDNLLLSRRRVAKD